MQEKVAAFVACVHLDDFQAYDLWCDERHVLSCPLPAGTVHINDMRHMWRADITSPFHVVNFYIPQACLDEITDEQGVEPIEDMHCPLGMAHVDNVCKNLALAFLPALARPQEINRLFADHASRAVIVHLAQTYGALRSKPKRSRSGLAPWQERRAKEMLIADLSAELGLQELASACRLSLSHFSHGFRQTVGCPPHRWLLAQRVERAKQLIINTKQSLSEIALATGFADQSHFTRVFSQRVKASPGAWRRAQQR